MKYLLLFTLTLSQLSFAETMKERKIKEEMLLRTDSLIAKTQEGRDFLEKEDVVSTCKKIEEIFELLPKHLFDIGGRMNLFDEDVITMEKQTRVYLIGMHRTHLTCKKGNDAENLDMDATDRDLKAMNKAFKKHKKWIKKLETNYENTYNYYYKL